MRRQIRLPAAFFCLRACFRGVSGILIAGILGIVLAASSARPAPSDILTKAAVETPELVLLDTDIGDDIDDAFALGLLLESPEFQLLGVTTTFGDTGLRARLAQRFLAATGRRGIPVAAGVGAAKTAFTQSAYAEQVPPAKYPDAADFLLDQIRAHPGQITLIAIGPLFNIQAAIERDPKTFRKLRRVVLMGGSIHRGYGADSSPDAEWNILSDPQGARALFQAGAPVFVMPLDSTQIPIEAPRREAIFAHGSPVTDQITLLYHQWAQRNRQNSGQAAVTPVLYDVVTVAFLIDPRLCPTTELRLDVDEQGYTRVVAGKPNARVCLKSDADGILNLLQKRLVR